MELGFEASVEGAGATPIPLLLLLLIAMSDSLELLERRRS